MIYFPKFLMHKVSVSTLRRLRPYAAAFHLGPIGIWYTENTDPFSLEQEKAEAWWVTISLVLSITIAAVLPSWYSLFGILPFWLYPGCYYVKFPGSVYFRRYFEIKSHSIELNSHGWYQTKVVEEWIKRRAWIMSRHRFYDLQLTPSEIEERLWEGYYTRHTRDTN